MVVADPDLIPHDPARSKPMFVVDCSYDVIVQRD